MGEKPAKPAKRGPKPGTPQAGGVPKGYVFPKTLQREEGKRLLQERVLAQLGPIVDALIGKAKGINHFMLRDPVTGQWQRLEDPVQIAAALNAPGAAEGSTYWIHTKDPDVAAAKDILDRSIGKPIEEIQADVKVDVSLDRMIRERFTRAG